MANRPRDINDTVEGQSGGTTQRTSPRPDTKKPSRGPSGALHTMKPSGGPSGPIPVNEKGKGRQSQQPDTKKPSGGPQEALPTKKPSGGPAGALPTSNKVGDQPGNSA